MRSQGLREMRLKCTLFAWIVVGYGVAARAVVFDGGTGEPNDPYRIATVEQLIFVGEDPNLLSSHFVLVAGIDLDPNLPGGRVLTQAMIASSSESPFVGSLDGAGHVIKNLTINGFFDAGLFGYVAASGIVKNLGLENARITGWVDVGGLVAHNAGSLSLCHSTGSVTGQSAGGLVGDNEGTVTSCYIRLSV